MKSVPCIVTSTAQLPVLVIKKAFMVVWEVLLRATVPHALEVGVLLIVGAGAAAAGAKEAAEIAQ